MDVETSTIGNDIIQIKLRGEIDLYNARQISETLLDLINTNHNKIVVNFAGVTYIDSTGIGIFIGGFKSLKKNGGGLKFASTRDSVSRIFKHTRLDTFFEFYDTAEDAAGSFG